MSKVEFLSDGTAILDKNTVVVLGNGTGSKMAKHPAEPYLVTQNRTGLPWMPYGKNNNYPETIRTSVEKNAIIRTALDYKANVMSAGEFQYGYMRWDDTLKMKVFEQLFHPDVELFLEYNDMNTYFQEALRDLYWWNYSYADLIKGDQKLENKDKIVNLSSLDHFFVRLGEQNKVTGKKDFCYIDANWNKAGFDPNKVVEVPLIDPYYLDTDKIVNSSATRFIFPAFFHTPGQIYYQPPPWHTVVLSGWVQYLDKIPEFKLYMLNNMMHLRWIIHIPDKWWELKFGKDFFRGDPGKRKTIMEQELTAFTETLQGTRNAGKAIMATYLTDQQGKELSKWTIEPLKADLGTGELLPESQEGANNILFSLALHASLIGNMPGKQMGAGSGSDIRVSFNNLIISNTPHTQKAAKAFEFVTRVNGWRGPNGEPIICRIDNSNFIQTLNSITPDQRVPQTQTDNGAANNN